VVCGHARARTRRSRSRLPDSHPSRRPRRCAGVGPTGAGRSRGTSLASQARAPPSRQESARPHGAHPRLRYRHVAFGRVGGEVPRAPKGRRAARGVTASCPFWRRERAMVHAIAVDGVPRF
jgi:hypothetical protein